MKCIRLFLWMTFLTGIAYPLLIMALAEWLMPHQASGALLKDQEKVIGSTLIAQKFESARYFWPRPSASDYNALASQGSNLAPTSSRLKQAVEKQRAKVAEAHSVDPETIPSELLFASGSGLDPHLSKAATYFQAARLAKARHIDVKMIETLIDRMESKSLFGPACINILLLNHSLDERYP